MTRIVRLKRPPYPHSIELDYFIKLRKEFNPWYKEFIESLENTGYLVVKIDDEFSDYFEDWKAKAVSFTSALKELAEKVNDFAYNVFANQSEKITGIEPLKHLPNKDKLIDSWVSQNVDLITNLGEDAKNSVKNFVIQAQSEGISTKKLKENIRETLGIEDRRAAKIARDQISKLNGRMTSFRHKSAGLEEYMWSTAGDQRVRKTHQALEGRTFRYGGYTPIGLDPGEDFQCRCSGIAVFPDSYFSENGIEKPVIEVDFE